MKVSCQEAVRLMSQAQEKPIGSAERLALQAHLALCRGCAAVEKHFAVLREAMRRLADGARGRKDGD
jgi:hypothetical protein